MPKNPGCCHLSKCAVAVPIEDMTAIAVEEAVRSLPEEQSVAGLLRWGQRVVQVTDGVRRIRDLEDEVRELLHGLRGDERVTSVETQERHIEFPKGQILVERTPVRLHVAVTPLPSMASFPPVRSPRQCIDP